MKINNFFKIGVFAITAYALSSGAIAGDNKEVNVQNKLSNPSIVKLIQDNINPVELEFTSQMALTESNELTQKVYREIKDLIGKKYGNEKLENIKTELNKTLINANLKNVNVEYTYAIPTEILKKTPNAHETESSTAYNGLNSNNECHVVIKLAVDNNGDLFESSELSEKTMKDISKMSKEEKLNVLKETITHEVSHCDLQLQNFQPKFSKIFTEKYPEIVKSTTEKIKAITSDNSQDKFDHLMATNYAENYADVMGVFARMGESPNVKTIADAKKQLDSIVILRSTAESHHNTEAALKMLQSKFQLSTKMSMEERRDLAREIATESLLPFMNNFVKKSNLDTDVLSSFYVGGLILTETNQLLDEIPFDKKETFLEIKEEIKRFNTPQIKVGFNLNALKQMREKSIELNSLKLKPN